jgi:hypothetical protein
MSSAIDHHSEPTASETFEGVSFFPIALVVSATIFPGMTLCIPGLIFGAAFILIPLLAVALVLLAVAAVIAAPVYAVRGIRELARRRADAKLGAADVAPSPVISGAA